MQSVNLKDEEIYSKVRLITPINAPEKDKNGENYWRAAYGKTVFIMRDVEAKDFSDGEMAELNLEPTSRKVDIDGVEQSVDGFAYAGHLTFKVALNVAGKAGKLRQLKNSFTVQVEADAKETVAA